jgi:predicted nucleotidyltransferase
MQGRTDMIITAIELPMDKIIEFCHKWQVTEFALFGSVLRMELTD